MLELTGHHIEKLNDEDLRELVFKLCEAELRRNDQPIAAVTAGGNQTATDGGVDVRVDIKIPVELDFIPRSQTVFQVKCEDMPASKIAKEMCCGGQLRASIAQLIALQGAYVIVSSKGTVADSRLKERREAMRVAMKTMPGAETVLVDFYDRNRLANWVRGYPGVEQWMRGRIGDPLSGWQAYGNWTGDRATNPYQKDELGRVLSKSSGSAEAMSVEGGINAIRAQLAKPGQSVRLIGLSGTGKTRMVQALFESGVGTSPLDTSIVVYTDQGLSPRPSARDMMQHLGGNEWRAIVVVDNCNPATHQALTKIVASYPTCLSLITVEYDVMDDEPEETQVFELSGSSPAVLEEILSRQAPHLSQNDRQRIVEFSDGNARVALALAHTVQKGQTLGVLNSADLFKRLFTQNHEPNEVLLRAAEVCSLVYSFEGESLDSADAELPILAAIGNLQPGELFRQVAELKRRKLVQTRSKWRAVLPHALANRLAKQALMNLPQSSIISAFQGHQRLLKSFSRRLGYLHDSPEACAIAASWMTDEKWLANLSRLNELGTTLFLNLAPLVPEQALGSLEAAIDMGGGEAINASSGLSSGRWLTLAHNLAYEPSLFDRAARVVLAYAVSEKSGNRQANEEWKELFHMHLSGTLAPPLQRVNFLRRLLSIGTPDQQQMATEAVSAMLNSSFFRSGHHFSFGARPRGYGWAPKSAEDVQTWYRSVFELVVEFAKPGSIHRASVRASVARHLRSLWSNLGMHEDVATLVKALAGPEGWPRGWAAVRITLRHDSKKMALPHLEMLKQLEQLLRPATLEQKVRAYVFLDNWDIADGEEDYDAEAAGADRIAAYERAMAKVVGLAKEVVANPPLLQKLLPDLLLVGSGQKHFFGKGLALSSPDVARCWQQLIVAFAQIDPSDRDTRLLAGFVEGAYQVESALADSLLNDAVYDSTLAEYFPLLEVNPCGDAGGRRLLDSLAHSIAPISRYSQLRYGLADNGMSVALYREILLKLSQLPSGFEIAIDSLGMKYFRCRNEEYSPAPELLLLGRELLGMFNFEALGNNLEHYLTEVATVCLQGTEATAAARKFCQRFAEAVNDYRRNAFTLGTLAETLFKHQPVAALDAFLEQPSTAMGYSFVSQFSMSGKSVVNSVDADVLLAWVKENPSIRAPRVAAEIDIYSTDSKSNFVWSPVAACLLEISPNRQDVLDGFARHFHPMSWSGSIASVLRPYQELIRPLTASEDTDIAVWATKQLKHMDERISQECWSEQAADERFE